jgi:hypothetical protein
MQESLYQFLGLATGTQNTWADVFWDHIPHKEHQKIPNFCDCELSGDLLVYIALTNNQTYYKILLLPDRTQTVEV